MMNMTKESLGKDKNQREETGEMECMLYEFEWPSLLTHVKLNDPPCCHVKKLSDLIQHLC